MTTAEKDAKEVLPLGWRESTVMRCQLRGSGGAGKDPDAPKKAVSSRRRGCNPCCRDHNAPCCKTHRLLPRRSRRRAYKVKAKKAEEPKGVNADDCEVIGDHDSGMRMLASSRSRRRCTARTILTTIGYVNNETEDLIFY